MISLHRSFFSYAWKSLFFSISIGLLSLPLVSVFSSDAHAQETKPRNTKKVTAAKNDFKLAPVTKNGFTADYQAGLDAWHVFDDAWKIKKAKNDSPAVISLHVKKSNYQPPHRSPGHIALIKANSFESFELNVKVLSTHKDYNHRDVCLFFGFKSPAEYYYVHLGKKTDPHANQIFIVNNADRTKISLSTTPGTNWDEKWHDVRIKRDIKTGAIEVYFDNMDTPVMTAKDKTFGAGMIGVGSFDDTADFGKLSIRPLK